jgi:hypothetical protein
MIFYSFSPIQKKVAFAPHRPDKRAGPHSCSDVRVKTTLQMLLFELMGKPMLKHRVGMSRPEILVIMTFMTNILNSF